MSVNINELRPEDRDRVAAFFLQTDNPSPEPPQAAQDPEPPQANPSGVDPPAAPIDTAALNSESTLSLVAQQDGRIVGAIVCSHDHDQGFVHRLVIAESHRGGGLDKTLVDKALLKLRSKGAHKCRILASDPAGAMPFWDAAKWNAGDEWQPSAEPPRPEERVVGPPLADATLRPSRDKPTDAGPQRVA